MGRKLLSTNSNWVGAFRNAIGVWVPGRPGTLNSNWKRMVESGTVTPLKVGSSQEKVSKPLAVWVRPKLEAAILGSPKLETLSKVTTEVFHCTVPWAPIRLTKLRARTGTLTVPLVTPITESAKITKLPQGAGAVKNAVSVRLQPGSAEKEAVTFTGEPSDTKLVRVIFWGLPVMGKDCPLTRRVPVAGALP